MSSSDQASINISMQEKLSFLTKDYFRNLMDHNARLAALEAKSLNNTPGHNHLPKEILKNFIENLSQQKLTEILQMLWDRDENLFEFAACQLVDCEEPVEASQTALVVPPVPFKRKRKTREEKSDLKILCNHCYNDYSVDEERRGGECRWHPGTSSLTPRLEHELILDNLTGKKHVNKESEFWDDWRARNNGPPDVDAIENEGGMYWDCCNENGFQTDGCAYTTHTPHQKRVKREESWVWRPACAIAGGMLDGRKYGTWECEYVTKWTWSLILSLLCRHSRLAPVIYSGM
jgi:hypothetical protein